VALRVEPKPEWHTPGFVRGCVTKVSPTTGAGDSRGVRRYLSTSGIPIRTARYQIEKRQLAKLRRQGFNSKQIAEQYGCSVTTVERALRRYGLIGH
jgi:hypothetical protein